MIRTTRTALFAALALALPASAAAGSLKVTLDGVQDRGGTLYVSVQTEAQFMKEEGIAGTIVAAPKAGTADFTFDLAPGEYAVSVWHDDNGNGDFDASEPYGVPLDGWAMSVDMSTLRGPPTFENAKLIVTEDGATVTLPMFYGR